jgi:hypothetical protein
MKEYHIYDIFTLMKSDDMITYLRESGREKLADLVEKQGTQTIREYSKELVATSHNVDIDPLLLQAFSEEMNRVGISSDIQKSALESFQSRRFIQTGPHLTPSISPRMSFISWFSSLSLEGEPYIEFSYSAIPFSNNMMPGAITWSPSASKFGPFKEKKNITTGSIENISKEDVSAYRWIVAKKFRDMLVFGSEIAESTVSVIGQIDPYYKDMFGSPKPGESYTAWALDVRRRIMKKILPEKNIVLVDGNEVVRNYLLLGLRDEGHNISKLFQKLETLEKALISAPLGFRNYVSGKKTKQEAVHLRGGILVSEHHEDRAFTKEILVNLLESRELCPGSFLFFYVLTFLNHVSCAGSFVQAEYLPKFQTNLKNLGFLPDKQIQQAPVSVIATGMFPDDTYFHALDCALGKEYTYDETLTLSEVITPLLELETMYGKV